MRRRIERYRTLRSARFDALDELVETWTNKEEPDGRHSKRR
jgi:hypothetical protein